MFTKNQLETMILDRCRTLASFAGIDTTIGTSSVLNDTVGFALRTAGVSTADPTNITDVEVSSVLTENLDMIIDLGEWRLLETIQGNLDDVDVIVGPERQNYSQITSQLSLRLLRLSRRLKEQYGIFKTEVEGGTILNVSSEGD